MSKITLVHETAVQAFKRKITELRPRLPKDWKLRFIAIHPEYDSYRGGVVLHNVINGQSTDPVVLEGIEKIVSEYENEQASKK